jgi:serine/threonine protein phosphatase PrpC
MQAIGEAYVKAEREFFSIAVDEENNKLLDKSGSCAVSALIMDEWCFIINLGDSRALYSFNSGKQLFQVTRDHKPNDPIEKERIVKAGGSVYHDNYVMINGKRTQIDDKQLPPGVSLPYRLLPGNIAVSIYLFFYI